MIDRSLYKYNFTETHTPDWMCPTCRKGILRIVKHSFNKVHTRESLQALSHPNWEPCFTTYIYSCLLQCNNDKCQDIVASTGGGSADIEEDYYQGQSKIQCVDHFRPTFFEPPLAMIDIPADCPAEVKEPLQESFRLFFCSPAAAGNNVRMAVEALLTQLGVPTLDTNPKSKPQRLSLWARLGRLPEELSKFRQPLDAIRLFGNDGSHPDSRITPDDVMDAYDLIDHVLQTLYSPIRKLPTEAMERMTTKFVPK